MTTVLLVIHVLLALGLVGAVLLQRSEGGALGIGGGGGGGGGGLMSGRASANLLTRITAVLAGLFMLTSLSLTWIAANERKPKSIMEGVTAPVEAPAQPAQPSGPSVPVGD